MRMTVKDLRAALQGVVDTALVTFQGNTESGEDEEDDEPSHTTCTGHVYSAFERNSFAGASEFVLDCAITDSEL